MYLYPLMANNRSKTFDQIKYFVCSWICVYFYHDLNVMTLNSFKVFTVKVTPQSVLWKYRIDDFACFVGYGKK